VSCETQGRERHYRLASPTIAEALETLARLAAPSETRSLRAANRNAAIRSARTCYDHLAGRLGVAVTEAFVARGVLRAGDVAFELTPRGEADLGRLGVDVPAARAQHRSFARACLDWSERRPHLAGALGAAVADAFLAGGWIARRPHDRGLRVTHAGAAGFRDLGVEL
jgi:hypothetical protein